MEPIIIAVDGYSSCGKSTMAKALAEKLGFAYLDTGAMYRAVSYYFLKEKIDWKQLNEQQVEKILDNITITFKRDKHSGVSETYLNGQNIEEEIRGKAVSDVVSEISQIKTVRKRMVDLQRQAGKEKGVVMDGRDIGTNVFSNAELKLFMTADPLVRAQRRYQELKGKGRELSLETVLNNLKSRDYQDTNRKENPLVKATDAIELDNTNLNPTEQLDFVINLLKERVTN